MPITIATPVITIPVVASTQAPAKGILSKLLSLPMVLIILAGNILALSIPPLPRRLELRVKTHRPRDKTPYLH